MKFVLSNSMNEEQVLAILNKFSRLSQKRTPCYLAMDNAHPLKQLVFKFLREEDAKDHLPRLRSQVTCNDWSEWSTCYHHF